MQWCEKAYELYSKALALEPENPAYLNDTAVMLHYYLDRELERAKEMYKQANARAKVLLERKDLKPDERELYKIAERDSRNNLAKLEKGIKTNG
jgi:tetratricopeptide (TPR) repeat protein